MINNKKGFALIELLLIMMVISSLFVVVLKGKREVDLDYLYLMNDYLSLQTDSIVNKKENTLNNKYSKYNIYFNENGNVNMAQTIDISNRKVIVHLGNGYITYEK